jgi:hypothetical protein
MDLWAMTFLKALIELLEQIRERLVTSFSTYAILDHLIDIDPAHR